jgi:hypothetical protein
MADSEESSAATPRRAIRAGIAACALLGVVGCCAALVSADSTGTGTDLF